MTIHADYYGVLTYRDRLIFYKIENHNAWQHRKLAVKHDSFLNKYICGLDRGIFQELPIFVPDILGSDDREEDEQQDDTIDAETLTAKPTIAPENQYILDEWQEENWNSLMTKIYDEARTHKWCIVQLYDAPPYWRVFTYKQIQTIDYDENDVPISANAFWSKRLPRSLKLKYHKETINLDPTGTTEDSSIGLFINWSDDVDEDEGGTDIEAIWSDNIYLRYLRLDIMNNSAKSSGFYHVKYGNGVTDAVKTQITNSFEKAGSGRAIGATENVIMDIVSHFPANPGFSVEAYDKVLKTFAGGCDLPLTYFNGEKENGGIFNENNGENLEVNRKMRFVFAKLKRYILKLVEMRWGVKCDDVFPNIPEMDDNDNYDEEVIEPREEDNKKEVVK